MITISQYVMSWIAVFVIVGAVWYTLDRKFGTGLYRWWHNMTHKEPLSSDKEMGFIYNQGVKARIAAATFLGMGQSLVVMVTTEFNPVVELIMLPVEVPVTMLGFYLGPFVSGAWSHRGKVVDAIERVERDGVSIPDPVKLAVMETRNEVAGKLKTVTESFKETITARTKKPAPVVKDPPKPKAPEPEINPQELMDRYTRR
jgi:hypothetical protein